MVVDQSIIGQATCPALEPQVPVRDAAIVHVVDEACFAGVEHWVFDLDNTLYPPEARLFDQIELRMIAWMMEALQIRRDEANRLRLHYWKTYGATVAGLIAQHGIDPASYLTDVYDICFDALLPDPALRAAIARLPGRKIIYTNASVPYAEHVVMRRGLSGVFDAIYGVEHAGYLTKPDRAAFEAVFAKDVIDPKRAAMFDDDARNLAAPHAMGMRTVHVSPTSEEALHIHHHTDDLTGFLDRVTTRRGLRETSAPWSGSPPASPMSV